MLDKNVKSGRGKMADGVIEQGCVLRGEDRLGKGMAGKAWQLE